MQFRSLPNSFSRTELRFAPAEVELRALRGNLLQRALLHPESHDVLMVALFGLLHSDV